MAAAPTRAQVLTAEESSDDPEAASESDEVGCGGGNEALDNDSSSSEEDASAPKEQDPSEGTSALQTVFNIVKNIVGEGMLSLSAGVAAGTGLITGILITLCFGGFLGYTFMVMGRVCHGTGKGSHKEAAAVVSGPILAESMAVVLMLKTTASCLSYAIVISESVPEVLDYLGIPSPSRQVVLIAAVLVVLLPLCLQRDLGCLSYTSLVGILCEVWVVSFMTIRLIDGSYQEGGQFYDSTKPFDRPFGQSLKWPVTLTTFILISSLSTAFIAHYNAPKFYSKMRNKSPKKWRRVVMASFAISMTIYVWVMTVGYLTFRQACEGLILNNYSRKDALAASARSAITVAVIFGFPLSFLGLRDSFISVLGLPDKKRNFAGVTIFLLAFVTTVACFVDDLGFVNSFGGSIFGSLITMIFPAILLMLTAKTVQKTVFSTNEVTGAWVFLVVGIVFMVNGGTVSICKKFFPRLLGL